MRRVTHFEHRKIKFMYQLIATGRRHAQHLCHRVWDIIFTLPVYRDLKMDKEVNFHTFQRLMADPEKWTPVQDPNSEGRMMYQGMLVDLACFAGRLLNFRGQISRMAEWYFEPLERRNSGSYAEAYADFCRQMASIGARLFNEDFEQSFPMEVSFAPMMHPTEDGKIFTAEKATFSSLTDFLRTEFYRGLAIGNAPRRSHNCGRFFLLMAGYNTCYAYRYLFDRINAEWGGEGVDGFFIINADNVLSPGYISKMNDAFVATGGEHVITS